MLRLVLLILVILLLVGALPVWPYSTSFGPYPVSGVAVVLIILLILIVAGLI